MSVRPLLVLEKFDVIHTLPFNLPFSLTLYSEHDPSSRVARFRSGARRVRRTACVAAAHLSPVAAAHLSWQQLISYGRHSAASSGALGVAAQRPATTAFEKGGQLFRVESCRPRKSGHT